MLAAPTLIDPTHHSGADRACGSARLWNLKSVTGAPIYTVPDLSIDLVWLPGEFPFVAHRTLEPFESSADANAHSVGVRFSPAVVAVWFDASWPGWRNARDRLPVLEAALRHGVVQTELDDRLALLLEVLGPPRVQITEAAQRIGVSERQLLRWAVDSTGLTPKQIHRHLRVRRFWEAGGSLPLAERSISAGFYDQAHATNEVRSITGLSPSSLLSQSMADSSKTWAFDAPENGTDLA